MREYALVLLVTAAVTYLLTPLVRRVAIATRAIHEPRARDTHTKATPLLGGLAMYGGLVAGLLLASRLSFVQDPFRTAGSRSEAGLLLAGGLVVIVGFADDRWGLSAISRLAAQVAAAGILVWSGQALPWLPLPNGGVFSLEPDLSVTLTILLVVVTMNAINFIDGLDGLAAGIVAVAALSFLAYSYTLIRTIHSTSQSLPAVVAALLAGMCIGFLPHNFYPARIFMGDIGAMLLGLLLAYGPISSNASLDPALLTNYAQNPTLDRFPTFLPLLHVAIYDSALQYSSGGASPTLTSVGTSADNFGYTSGSPVVTSSGSASGSALVWVIDSTGSTGANAQLRAYNPIPVNGVLQLVLPKAEEAKPRRIAVKAE